MLGKLIALSKNGEEKESLPVVNLHFFIGSDLFCDLRINHKDIAAQHCLITSQKNKPALIRNLSRTVPTLVNNTEIGSSDVELKDNDIIAIRHKNYKWCYDSSTPSTSSQTSYVVTSKNRKSWPLFKNKLVAVVTPQRRDEENEVLPKKRRGTIAEENISKSKSAPKVLAIKSGIRATNMPSFGKRKLSVKTTQSIASIQGTPKELPTLNRKSVKFLDTSAPRSRLGMRGRNGSLSTPYKSTPAKQKVSVYSTPPSSFRQDKKKPIKSILKTPSSSSTTPRKNEYDEQHLLQNSGILTTPLSNVPEITIQSPSLLENELLQTPTVGNQPEIIMRSSRRKATAIRSPPSTPKSITKKRKSPEEKSIEASERAAKKLKKGPPHAIDKKKRAALLKCHRKSLTPHPVARRSGKLIINFPSSLSRRLEVISPSRTKVSPKSNNTSNSEKFSAESSTSNVLKSSSLDIQTDSEIILHNTISQEKLKPGSRKNSRKSFLKGTTPTVRKFTRASRAACISNNLPQKKEATDVLSALDLSRRWPSPLQGEAFGNSTSQDVSNLSGFKKLFSADKTLDVRELFLEKNSELEITNEKSFQKLPETNFGRISRRSALLKGKQSTDKEELMHSFHSEGAQDQLCSDSLLSGSLSSFPSCSSTSRRSLSLKQGRRSTVSPKDTNSLLIDDQRTQEQSPGKKIAQSSDHVNINSYSSPRKTRRTYSMVNGDSIENNHLTRLSKSISDKLLNMANEISKNCIDQSHFSSPLNDTSRNSFDDCNVSREGLNDSTSDASVFSLGSFNSSYHKSRSGADLSLSQVISDDKGTPLDNSLEGETSVSNKDVPVLIPGSNKLHSRGRISLRRTVLLASTPKPGKLLRNNVSKLSSDVKVDAEETSIHKNRLYNEQLIRNRNFTPDITSGKLKKIMKGKGFIGKTSSRFTSLPLTTDSSVLKDLSAISTSVGNLRASLRNKGNQSGLKLDLLKNSISLIKNNNMDSSVTELSSIQSTSDNLRDIADQSNIEEEPKIVLESHISNGPRRSHRKTENSKIKHTLDDNNQSISKISTINNSIGNMSSSANSDKERGRISVMSLGHDKSSSIALKKRSRSLPSLTDKKNTHKQNLSISENFLKLRRSNRKYDDKIVSRSGIVSSSSTPLTFLIKSDETINNTPIVEASINTTRRRGRPSKFSVKSDNSQSEKSIILENHSQSLPSLSNYQINLTSEQMPNVLNDSGHLRRSSRRNDGSKILNITSSSLSVLERDNSTISVIQTSPEKSFGRRGRQSKFSFGSNVQFEDSAMIKKRSQSLPSRSDGQITSKNTSNILDDSVHLRRSTRKTNDNNKAIKMHANMSSFKLKKDKKDINGTSIIQTSPDKSFKKRGRPSKLSIDSDNVLLKKPSTLHNKTESDKEGELSLIMKSPVNTSRGRTSRPSKSSIHSDDPQLEKPTIVDKLNLPSSDNICQPRQSRLKGEDSETSNKALFDSPLSSPTISLKRAVSDEDIYATPNISKVSFGPRGKHSKVSVSPGNYSEKSNILKENSLNQGSMSDNQITPMHAPTNLDHSCSLRKNCHQNEKIINNISLNLFDDKTVSKKSVDTPKINNLSSIHTSTRRKGRPKRSVPFDSHTLQPNTSKRRSRSLPSSTENLTTPEPTVCALDNISHPRRSSRKANVSNIVSLSHSNTPSASLSKLSFKTPDKEIRPNFNILSVGNSEKRNRSYKINHSPTKESIILEKDLQNKMLLTEIKATLKHALGSPEITLHPRRSSRKSNDTSLITEIPENVLPTKLTNSDDLASCTKIDGSPKRTLLTLNTSVGRTGRSSKILEFDNRGINKEVTPEQSSSILNNDDRSRRGSRKQDDIKVFQKTSIDELDSDKKVNMSKSLVEVPNVSIGSRGIQSKISANTDDSKLENSGVVKKRSRSLPSTADGKKLNKSDVVTLSSLQTTLIDETASDEIFATPNISGTSSLVKSSSGKRDKSSKMIVSPNNSQLKGSSILEKISQNVNASGGKFSPEQGLKTLDNFDPPRRSSRKEIGKVLSKTGMNSSSALHGKPGKEVNTTPKISTTSPVKNIIGKQSKHINSSSELNESYLKKSTVLKKHSQSLTSLPVDQDINVHEYSQHHRRNTRRTVINEISNSIPSAPKTSSSNETNLKKEIIKISDSLGSEASELFNISENTSVPTISQCKVNKSKKRKFEEFYEGSVPKNSLSFSSSSDDNGFSRSRKKVKINNDSTMFSDSNKRTTYSGSVAGNIKAFVAFSSTPIITKNPYSVNNAGVKNLRSSKFKNMSPMGLSPIMASNETDSSGNKESSQISMICLRHSECPSDINQSDSFVSSSNMLYVEENRSLNSLDVTSGSNSGTNNSKVKFNKKAAKRISTSQDQLPIANQNPDSSHFPPVVKEDKSIELLAQIKKSCHSKDSAHESLKGEVNNTSFRLKSSKTPVIKLSPGKSVVPSRKKQNNFLDLKNHENSIHENSVEKIIAPPQTDCVSMRETSLQKLSSSNKSTSSLKISEQAVTSLKSPIARRRGRPPKPKDTSETSNSTNKIVTAAQRRGRSAKNIDSNLKLENTEAPIQKLSKRNKGKKTIPAKDSSCSTKKNEVNVDTTSDRTLSEKVEQNSFVSFPKTRSKVAVSALRTPRKSVIISSPIVKSLSLNRRRVGKSKLEKTLTPPHIQKQGRLAKGRTGNTLEDPNVLIDNSSAIEKNKGKKTRAKNSSQLKKNTDTEKQKDDSSSPVKRRGRSAVYASNGKETQVGTSNIMAKRKVINEVIEEPSTLPPNRRGRSVVKNSNSNKKGKLEQDQENNNKIIASPSLTKKGRTDKVQDIVLSDSVKKSLASENTLRRGRSVPKHSESFKTEKHQNNLANGNETIASFSQSLPKRGRNAKVPLNSAAAINKTARKTSESESSLRRGRSDVKKSDSFMKQAKLKKDTIKNIEMIPSTSLPKEGRSTKKVQVKAVTDSRTKHNNKDSETEEVQTTKKKRGRSAMRENNSELGPEKELITLKSEEDGSLSIDSTLPKRGRSTNRRAKTVSESNESRSTFPLPKRGRQVVENSNSTAKRGKSKKGPTVNNVDNISPSLPKRGRPAKTTNKVLESTVDQNCLQRRGRSAAVEKQSTVMKGKLNKDLKENSVAEISSSKKRGRPAMENGSPTQERSVASKRISPVLERKSKAPAKDILKLPRRRGNTASSPLAEVHKVSERSKAIKKNSKIKDSKPLKSAIKKNLSKRLSRKSSSIGIIKNGRRKVHFNKNVVRNSGSRKK